MALNAGTMSISFRSMLISGRHIIITPGTMVFNTGTTTACPRSITIAPSTIIINAGSMVFNTGTIIPRPSPITIAPSAIIINAGSMISSTGTIVINTILMKKFSIPIRLHQSKAHLPAVISTPVQTCHNLKSFSFFARRFHYYSPICLRAFGPFHLQRLTAA